MNASRLFAKMLLIMLLVAGFVFTTIQLSAQGAAAPTYSVTGTTYVTLATTSGTETFCQFGVGVTGGQGGGAVTSAVACGKDVSSCVKGTVSGASGAILVNVSDKACEKAMRACKTIVVTLANGNTVSIDVPGFLVHVRVDTFDQEVIPGGVHTFPLLTIGLKQPPVAQYAPGGAASGTISSLPPKPEQLVAHEGSILVEISTSGAGPQATILTTQGHQIVPGPSALVRLDEGGGFVTIDTSNVEPGATVTIKTSGIGVDNGYTTWTVGN